MDISKDIIGKKIKRIRLEKGISQEKLAEQIDISTRQMCMIENGNSYPSLETFINISEVLDIDINKFFNKNIGLNDDLRNKIYDLIQISDKKELKIIKDILMSLHKNR